MLRSCRQLKSFANCLKRRQPKAKHDTTEESGEFCSLERWLHAV